MPAVGFASRRLPATAVVLMHTVFSDPTSRRTFWQRRVRDPIIQQLTQGITPEKLALTIAVGSAVALFPVLGTTTILCFIVGLVFRLNQPLLQLLNQALWPVHVPVIYGCLRLGERMFGVPPSELTFTHAKALLWSRPSLFFEEFGLSLVHAIAAWALVAPASVLLVYAALRPILRSIYRARLGLHASSSGRTPPGDHRVG